MLNLKIAQQYLEGYNTGIKWPDQWETHGKPGGPFVDRSEQSMAENRAWKGGWEEGYTEKLRIHKIDKRLAESGRYNW